MRISQIAEKVTKGTTPTTLGFSFMESGINFIKVESIDENGKFLSDKIAYISNDCHHKLERSQLKENDILFSIAGALGRVAIVNKDILPANTNQALAIVRLREKVNNVIFIKLALSTPQILDQIENFKKGIAQQNLSLEQIASLQIPLPPLESQEKIVSVIEVIESKIAHIDSSLESLEKEKAEILNRSLNDEREERERQF